MTCFYHYGEHMRKRSSSCDTGRLRIPWVVLINTDKPDAPSFHLSVPSELICLKPLISLPLPFCLFFLHGILKGYPSSRSPCLVLRFAGDHVWLLYLVNSCPASAEIGTISLRERVVDLCRAKKHWHCEGLAENPGSTPPRRALRARRSPR